MTAHEAVLLAEVRAILTENAELLGQPQDTFLRVMPNGSYRVQMRVKGRWSPRDYKAYPTITSLRWAAGVSNERAHAEAAKRGKAP